MTWSVPLKHCWDSLDQKLIGLGLGVQHGVAFLDTNDFTWIDSTVKDYCGGPKVEETPKRTMNHRARDRQDFCFVAVCSGTTQSPSLPTKREGNTILKRPPPRAILGSVLARDHTFSRL